MRHQHIRPDFELVDIARVMVPRRKRKGKFGLKPGQPNRSIVLQGKSGEREYYLHATKGWRSRKL